MPRHAKKNSRRKTTGKKRVSKRGTKAKKKSIKRAIAKRKSVKPASGSTTVYYSSPPRTLGIRRTQRVKLPYCWSSNGNTLDAVNQDTLGNNYYIKHFRLNSLYDPDYGGVGHQPRYADEWGLWYTAARVNGVKVELDINDNTTNPISVFVWVSPLSSSYPTSNGAPVYSAQSIMDNCGGTAISSTSTASYNKLQELPYIKCFKFDANGTAFTRTFSHYYNINKEFDLKVINKADLVHAFQSSDPTAGLLLNIMIAKDDNSTFTNGAAMNVRLTYYATLSDPTAITTS